MMKFTTASSLLLNATLVIVPVSVGWADSLTGTDAIATEEAIAPQTQTSDLVGRVMSQLGLSENQAEGGLGSLLSLAQSNLGENDFSTLANSLPDTASLLAAVPVTDADSGMSGLLSKAGALGASLQGSAMVYDAFEKLGISNELIVPMIDIAKSYLETNGPAGTVDLLMKGVGALL